LLLRTLRENQWLLIKGNDEFESKDDLTITRPESVLTGTAFITVSFGPI
jgi:hypothetical protein